MKWQRIIAWGRTADQVSRMLHKGDKVRIQGKLQFYTVNLKNGKTREQEEIILDQFSIELKSSETTSLRA
ncbi:MAG: single-stranded DNA-binding protein [Saprospiraceae bacterium]|nr:single-stranded DNA-binding protein [Saprospiraceae bacterium]